MNPKRLVFCGGGTRCLTFLQTLVDLENAGRLRHVNDYWGTSAGALIASLLAISKSPMKVKQTMFSADYTKFRDMDVGNLLSLGTTWGLDDGRSLTRELERMINELEPEGKDKTMADLKTLHIVVSDLNLREMLVVDSTTFPTVRIVDAIRASMCLPFFFRPYVNPVNGHYWVDGALRANFPWMLLPNDEARRESLGFTFDKSVVSAPKTLLEYIFSMVHFDEPKKFMSLKQSWSPNILFFDTPPFPPWFTNLKEEDFRLVETMGSSVAQKWLTAGGSSCPPETTETPLHSAPHCTPSSAPQHHRNETSDIHSPSPLPSQDSSPPQLLSKQPSSRRWSV